MRASHWCAAALFAAACILFASPSTAEDEGWRLRFGGVFGDTSAHAERRFGSSGYRRDTGTGGGAVNAEYRYSTRLGVEIGLLGATGTDFRARTQVGDQSFFSSDVVSLSAATVGLNVHLTPKSRADLYAGALVAFVRYAGFDVETYRFGFPGAFPGGTVIGDRLFLQVDDEVAAGLNLGVDVPFGKGHWLFNADLKYLNTDGVVSGVPGGSYSVANEPLLLGLGAGYRF